MAFGRVAVLALRQQKQMSSRCKILQQSSLVLFGLLLLVLSDLTTPAQDAKAQASQAGDLTIILTAIDKNQRFVTTLKADDLQLLEDGAQQKIVGFQLLNNRPLSLAILIDTSISQERTLPGQKIAATYFIDSIIRPGVDRVAVATFTGTLEIQQKFTTSLPSLREAIARIDLVPPPGYAGGGVVIGPTMPATSDVTAGSTAIWDVVTVVCDEFQSESSGTRRHAIILFTDGHDTTSKKKIADAVDRANGGKLAIYSIGFGDPALLGVDKSALRKVSERTGGRAFFPKRADDLRDTFAEIGEELRTQYLITYSPTGSQRSARKIRVEIINPALRSAGLQLSYQQMVPRKP